MSYIKKKFKLLRKHFKKLIKMLSKNVVISIGENCLADNILSRNGVKSFSSPYASARSNIEFVLDFEKERFVDFLNPQYLMYKETSTNKVVHNNKYTEVKNKYYNSCTYGFEFTHHNVIDDEEARKKIKRRCKRLLSLKNKNIVMLYHHRICEETDINLLTNHLQELSQIYRERQNDIHIFLFTQNIVSSDALRRVDHSIINGIDCYVFYTMHAWAGDNDEYLWATCDNDLLETMIIDIKKTLI